MASVGYRIPDCSGASPLRLAEVHPLREGAQVKAKSFIQDLLLILALLLFVGVWLVVIFGFDILGAAIVVGTFFGTVLGVVALSGFGGVRK